MRQLFAALLFVFVAANAGAAPYICRYLNYHRGPAPRVLHVELWCTDDNTATLPPCSSFRETKVFRFLVGTTALQRRAEMRQEARRYMRLVLRQNGCAILDNDADNATVNLDDQNP